MLDNGLHIISNCYCVKVQGVQANFNNLKLLLFYILTFYS
jgi:hypothetical protein